VPVIGHPRCYDHLGFSMKDDPARLLEIERRANPLAGEPYNIAPGAALLWRVTVLAGEVRRLDAKIALLEEDELLWGEMEVTTEESDSPSRRVKEGSRIHLLVMLRERRERQLQSACEAALHAGAEAAMVELARDQVAFMKRVILVALNRRAGIAEDDPWLAEALPQIIREIAG
jgi:hypothetical protein